ncbi:MAG TPA: A/G-specific adenine glycosylase [Acidimicrobiales bacterium]|nr:A/G-specific adenine glycosylase [Acidimicrobiales bacterium]
MEPPAHELERVRQAVLDGAGELWRDLPWRATRDPWLVLVSEVMLQQTQARRVVAPYLRFAAAFPTPTVCAAAGAAEVVRAWAGLGYNRRALNLHRTAVSLVERHSGQVPTDLDALLDLPGVGPYTARAVLAFAYGHAIGVVDTNVARVLSRAIAGRALRGSEAQRLADRLVPTKGAWRFNQAMFDLGARRCTARSPQCDACSLAVSCRWASTGGGQPDPVVGGRRRQGAFAGSDRQGRGRLVAALRHGPVPAPGLPGAAGWPDDGARALRIAGALVDEGIARWCDGILALA